MTYPGTTPHAVTASGHTHTAAAAHRPNVLTAQQFIDQGFTTGNVWRLATILHRRGQRQAAAQVRLEAAHVAAITGEPVPTARVRRSANDNRRSQKRVAA